jgi:hypothetical protein
MNSEMFSLQIQEFRKSDYRSAELRRFSPRDYRWRVKKKAETRSGAGFGGEGVCKVFFNLNFKSRKEWSFSLRTGRNRV